MKEARERVNVEYTHWCGVIFDMDRRIRWKYDLLHKKMFLDEVENIITGVFMKITKPDISMKIQTFPGWLQRHGHSCVVLAVHWFEVYLSLERSTPLDQDLHLYYGPSRDPKQLLYVWYKHFSYIHGSVRLTPILSLNTFPQNVLQHGSYRAS